MVALKDFMAEQKLVNRWLISIVFLAGMFAGAAITIVLMLSAVLPK